MSKILSVYSSDPIVLRKNDTKLKFCDVKQFVCSHFNDQYEYTILIQYKFWSAHSTVGPIKYVSESF